eukprot:Em0798g1a
MVRPYQMAKEDFWHALGRWSGPIRQLWRISGMLWEDGQAPSDSCGGGNADLLQEDDGQAQVCGFLECSGKIDDQAPSDSYGGFLACSRKMVMSRTEDFWLALGRWSGPIRLLWRISGVLWEDGQAPSDSCGGFLECSGKMVRPHQKAVEYFWHALGRWKMVRLHQTAVEDFWLAPGRWSGPIRWLWRISGMLQDYVSQGFNTYNGSDGHPGVLTGLDLWERRESHCPMLYSPRSPRRVILVYQGWLGLQAILLAPQVEGAPGTPEAAADLSIPLRFLRLKYSSVRQNITYDCGSGVDGFTKMRHQAADSTTFQFGVGTEEDGQVHDYKDFWSALGRWSGPIRQLWRISGKMIRPHQTAVEDALGR